MAQQGMPPMQQQQPQAGMPKPAMGGAPGGMLNAIHAKLSSVVAANQLQRFYQPQALQALASRLDARVNFRDLAARCTVAGSNKTTETAVQCTTAVLHCNASGFAKLFCWAFSRDVCVLWHNDYEHTYYMTM
jgi:hypothetical protein